MKKINNSKQIMTYVILFGLLAVAMVYFLVYQKYSDKTAALKIANNEKAVKVAELQTYYENKGFYEEEIAKKKAEMVSNLSSYPEKVQEEDVIMLAVNTVTDSSVAYTSISMADPSAYYTVDPVTVSSVNWADSENEAFKESFTMNFMRRDNSYYLNCDYINLKEILKIINEENDKKTITNILFTKNEEHNNLEGIIELSFFYVPEYGYEYTPVDMAEYTKGLENLFKLKDELEEEEEDK